MQDNGVFINKDFQRILDFDSHVAAKLDGQNNSSQFIHFSYGCHPNALMTLTEYLVDYASEETKKHGFELIEKELEKIPKEKVREIARKNIEDIKASNRRDFRF